MVCVANKFDLDLIYISVLHCFLDINTYLPKS